MTIRFLDPVGKNANGDTPTVSRVDLIRGTITGRDADRSADRNTTTRVEARFTSGQWQRRGDYIVIEHVLKNVAADSYFRIRGTNTTELEPAPDAPGESAWQDLWFYSNPVFLKVE